MQVVSFGQFPQTICIPLFHDPAHIFSLILFPALEPGDNAQRPQPMTKIPAVPAPGVNWNAVFQFAVVYIVHLLRFIDAVVYQGLVNIIGQEAVCFRSQQNQIVIPIGRNGAARFEPKTFALGGMFRLPVIRARGKGRGGPAGEGI